MGRLFSHTICKVVYQSWVFEFGGQNLVIYFLANKLLRSFLNRTRFLRAKTLASTEILDFKSENYRA
jgi:hypothetical protein